MDIFKLVIGTHNQSKVDRIKTIVSNLPVEIYSLSDFNIYDEVDESGSNVHENATKKAKFYFSKTNIPTLSIDTSLYIDKFNSDSQPGTHVRRINGKNATDDEILSFYKNKLDQVGGESTGRWISSIVFVSKNKILSYELLEERIFISKSSSVRKKGFPLSSLAIDPTFNKYVSEISEAERESLQEQADHKIYEIINNLLKSKSYE